MKATVATPHWAIAQMMSFFVLVQTGMAALVERTTERRETSRVYAALWVPIVIVMAGAAAMTIWCNIRGYNGWKFELTWRGFRARCY